jgi:hypothetical protein
MRSFNAWSRSSLWILSAHSHLFAPDLYFQYLAIIKEVAPTIDHFSLSYSLNGLPDKTKASILHCSIA